MLYNLAIETQRTGIKFIQALNDDDLKQFVAAYDQGRDSVTINGEKVYLEYPELVKIFDVSKKINPTSRSHVVSEMQKWVNIMNKGKLSLDALREYGEDVTSQFITGEWGEKRKKPSEFFPQGSFQMETNIRPKQNSVERRYWAGGFGKGNEFYERLEDFKRNNYWKALDYDEDSNQNAAELAWSLFREIKKGDWFLIKGFGGGNIRVHYVGEVISKNEEDGRLDFKRINVGLYRGESPKGEGAGNWFNTLLEIYREEDIQKLFYNDIPLEDTEAEDDLNKKDKPKESAKDISIIKTDFVITEGDEAVIGVDALAAVMANLLKSLKETDKGKMVGIFGNWGRGKTFLADKIWKILETDRSQPFIRVDFHAWKYQDTPASWAYLYEAFTKRYFKAEGKKNFITKEFDNLVKLLELNHKRLGLKPLLLVVFSVLCAILGYLFTKELKEVFRLFIFFGGMSLATAQLFLIGKKTFSREAKQLFKKYYTKTSFSGLLGVQAEIQNELKLLLKTWIPENKEKEIEKRILLFVDDIDRCSEERIMPIIDALRVMLEDDEISRRVIVLSAVDERVLKRAIKWKYHDLLVKDFESDNASRHELSKNIANEYMDKLFLSGIHLGSLTEKDRQAVLSKYIRGRVYSDTIKQEKNKNAVEINEQKSQESSAQSGDLSVHPVITSLPNYKVLDNPKYDLTEDEKQFLSGLMAYNETATPRQIRIFYYRYLLSRNILLDRLSLFDVNENLRLNLAKLLMHHTINPDLNLLRSHKNSASKSKEETMELNMLNDKIVFNTSELREMYEVLEMVIAY